MVADQLLRHEGGVGAEHDQLAMRHVDHPHHPEGDGEADRGEQQHRAERQPEPDVLQLAPHRLRSRSISATAAVAASAISGSSEACSGVSADSASLPPRPATTPTAATRSASVGVGVQQRRRLRLLERLPDAGILFRRQRRLDRLELLGVGGAERLVRGRQPPRRIGGHERQRRDRRPDRPAQRVVDLDRHRSSAAPPARARRRSAGRRPRRFEPAPGDPDHRAVRLAGVQVALLQRFEHRRRPVVAGRADRRHHLGAIAEAALRQLRDQLLERLRRTAEPPQDEGEPERGAGRGGASRSSAMRSARGPMAPRGVQFSVSWSRRRTGRSRR